MSLVSGRRLGVVAAIYTYTAVVVDCCCKLLIVGCRLELLGLCCQVLSAVVVREVVVGFWSLSVNLLTVGVACCFIFMTIVAAQIVDQTSPPDFLPYNSS
jgi:hypothetical protein